MTAITDQANTVFRDSEVFGVPSSGPNDPDKRLIRALFALIDVAIENGGFTAPPDWAETLASVESQLENLVATAATVTDAAGALADIAGEIGTGNTGVVIYEGGSGFDVAPRSEFKGDPGGNTMAVGLWSAISGLTIPVGTDLIQTSGEATLGLGSWDYTRDTDQTTGGITQYRRQDAAGSWFKKVVPTEVQLPKPMGAAAGDYYSYLLSGPAGAFYAGGIEASPTNDEQNYWADATSQLGRAPGVNDVGIYAQGGFLSCIPMAYVAGATSGHDGLGLGVASETGGAGCSTGAASTAALTGSIAGTTLTVTDVSWGPIANGQVLRSLSAAIVAGTTIVAQLEDSLGLPPTDPNFIGGWEGTYTVSHSQTVASGALLVGLIADATTAEVGYGARAHGKDCQAVMDKSQASGELSKSWCRAGIAQGYMALAKRGIAAVAQGYRVTAEDPRPDSNNTNAAPVAIGARLLSLLGGMMLGYGINDGSPARAAFVRSVILVANAFKGQVEIIPGTSGDSFTGSVGIRGGLSFLADVGDLEDEICASIKQVIDNTGAGSEAVGLHGQVLHNGALVDAFYISPTQIFRIYGGVEYASFTVSELAGINGTEGEVRHCSNGNAGAECLAAWSVTDMNWKIIAYGVQIH
jgi:hypothetical protein